MIDRSMVVFEFLRLLDRIHMDKEGQIVIKLKSGESLVLRLELRKKAPLKIVQDDTG